MPGACTSSPRRQYRHAARRAEAHERRGTCRSTTRTAPQKAHGTPGLTTTSVRHTPPASWLATHRRNHDADPTTGNFLVTAQIADIVAAHTANDIPLSACGHGAELFGSTMDNIDAFFAMMQATVGGSNGREARCE